MCAVPFRSLPAGGAPTCQKPRVHRRVAVRPAAAPATSSLPSSPLAPSTATPLLDDERARRLISSLSAGAVPPGHCLFNLVGCMAGGSIGGGGRSLEGTLSIYMYTKNLQYQINTLSIHSVLSAASPSSQQYFSLTSNQPAVIFSHNKPAPATSRSQ